MKKQQTKALPLGKKFIYAAGITASRWLLKTVADIPSLISLASEGRAEKCKDKTFFCISNTHNVIIQPAFWAHSISTVQCPAFVMGWEAGTQENQKRLQTVQYSFARGLGMEAQNAIRQMTMDEQGKISP